MSDTPLTDAILAKNNGPDAVENCEYWEEFSDLCRTLERELSAERERAEKAERELAEARATLARVSLEAAAQSDSEPVEARPLCAVGGMVRRGAMCGSVIVGGKYCGHGGECQHKVPNKATTATPAAPQ